MKLDYDCVRDLLLEVEKLDFGEYFSTKDLIAMNYSEDLNYPTEALMYTAKILCDGGYLEAEIEEVFQQPIEVNVCNIYSLTFKGHEYLNSVRDTSIWKKFKEIAKKSVLPFTLEIVQNTCSNFISDLLTSGIG